ncbi:MAG: catalase [Bacteroidota bacterium]|nr:catalase [Bacteroidota bacterium]
MMKKIITTSAGKPIYENEDSMTVGPRGPILLQDHHLLEKLAHFNRERIPDRVIHAKGSGAYGKFTVTHDISKYTRAKLFEKIGTECHVFARFSMTNSEKGSPDTDRDIRGLNFKFYTEEGNWDLMTSSFPVSYIKDAKMLPDLIHALRRDPQTNLKSPISMWDYLSLNPESLHLIMMLFTDRGTPYSYRFVNGYGVNTYSMVNAQGEYVWVKFHLKAMHGVRTFSASEAEYMRSRDLDWAQRDLVMALRSNDYPTWKLQIQVMNESQAKNFRWNPFDPTKVWPHNEYPLIDVGILEFTKLPENYFADVEQAAFSPDNVIDGIGFSPDRLLQGMAFMYSDANRYRLGPNYQQIPVNRPTCPVFNGQRDGVMAVNGNGGSSINYEPNSFNGHSTHKHHDKEAQYSIDSNILNTFHRNENDDDHYTQPRWFYNNVLKDSERQALIKNIIDTMRYIGGPKREEIIQRQLGHFYLVDKEFAHQIADGLSVDRIPEQEVEGNV